MSRVFLVVMDYGNPSVVQIRECWSDLERAKVSARAWELTNGRTHVVYEVPCNPALKDKIRLVFTTN